MDYRRLLDWFVSFARTNLETLSPEKLRERREEARALQEVGAGGARLTEYDASTAAQLPRTQTQVAQYLERLTKTGTIEFEEFTLTTSILVPRFRPGPTLPYSIIVGEHVDPLHGKGLLYQLFLALKNAGDRLRRCPACEGLFVQARRKQRVCTPLCRVRDWRTRQQKMREAREMRKRVRQTTGGKSHGTKKR